MFKHLHASERNPKRTVILGAGGFVGSTLYQRLQKEELSVLKLTRQQLNLLDSDASVKLAALLRSDDALVITAAEAPCKNTAMLYRNITMMHAVCEALKKQVVQHIVYISSDAVYADSDKPLTETSSKAPDSLHGIMHVAREMMLQHICNEVDIPLAILRPSLLYGAQDPHNGYGPNRFRRLAHDHQPIVLFGEGEERRDHVYIEDVAEIIFSVIQHRSCGALNIATGSVFSFKEIAEKVIQLSNNHVAIQSSPRQGPMPHNGYRPFDNSACLKAFPNFSYTQMDTGLRYSQDYMQTITEVI